VSLVEVYATVTDAHGQAIAGLTAADFRITEDGESETITTFAAGEFPLAVALALDRSFSMASRKADRLAMAKAAAATFVGALRPVDEVMVLSIGSEVSVESPLGTDRGAALAAIDRLDAWGTTSLYDATLKGLDLIQAAHGRRALVLISDGIDRYSRTSASGLLEEARRRDVLVYPVSIGATRPPFFAELASATGGRLFFVGDPRQLADALSSIARDLRSQYLLGYAPRRPLSAEPRWHGIEVSVLRPGSRVRARDGYFSR
jgi:Ca-activated chloride channel family protein